MHKRIGPKKFAPLFIVTTIVHGVAVVSRYREIGGLLPPGVAEAILLAHVPLLLIEGLFEGYIDYGDSSGPLWMQIKSRPVKWSFTLAFTYLGIVVLQAWNISIGPINPNPPPSFPPLQSAMWFGMMTLGMFFPNYLATTSILIPILRFVTKPFRLLPPLPAAVVLVGLGMVVGYFSVGLMSLEPLANEIRSVKAMVWSNPLLAVGVTLGFVFVPMLLGALIESIRKQPKE